MAPEVAVKRGCNMVQLVEERDELVIEFLIEKTRQAKRHDIQHFPVADKIALHLVRNSSPPPSQPAFMETQGRYPGLQTMSPAAAGLGHRKQQPSHIDVAQGFAVLHDIRAQPLDMHAEVKRPVDGSAGEPPRSRIAERVGAGAAWGIDGEQREWSGPVTPAAHKRWLRQGCLLMKA